MMKKIARLFKYWAQSFSGLSSDVWKLSLITLINRSGTVVVIFLSIYLTEELGLGKSQVGIVIGCFGAGSLMGNFLGGFLTDRLGYYRVMAASLSAVGFFYFSMLYVHDFVGFCSIVFFTGLVGDAYRPASDASVAAYSKLENRSRTLSLLRLAINLGFAIGSAAVGFISGIWGYKWLFIIDAGSCMLAAVAFLFFMENKKEMLDEEKENTKKHKNAPHPPRSAYQDGWYLLFLVGLALCSFPFFQLFTAYPVFLREVMGFSEMEYGAIMAFNGILLFLFEMPIIHYLTQRHKEYPSLVLGAYLIGASFLLYVVFGHHAWVAISAMAIIALGEILNFPFSTTVALGRSRPQNRGQYMGLFSMTFAIIFIFAPWVGMKVVELHGYKTLWLLMGTMAICGGLMLHTIRKWQDGKPPRKPETNTTSPLDEHLLTGEAASL